MALAPHSGVREVDRDLVAAGSVQGHRGGAHAAELRELFSVRVVGLPRQRTDLHQVWVPEFLVQTALHLVGPVALAPDLLYRRDDLLVREAGRPARLDTASQGEVGVQAPHVVEATAASTLLAEDVCSGEAPGRLLAPRVGASLVECDPRRPGVPLVPVLGEPGPEGAALRR